MLGRTLGVAATAAVGAGAFLLPAGINIENDPLFITGLDPKNQIFRMPCASCVFSSKAEKPASILTDDETFHAQGGAIDVVFNVSISSDNQLLINGDVVDDWHQPQHVFQVPASASAQDIVNMETKMEILRITGIMAQSHSDKVMIHHKYSISSLDTHPVHLDDLEIDLLTLDDGELAIVDVRRTPTDAFGHLLSDLTFNGAKKQPQHADHPPAPSSDCAHAGPFHKMFCEIKSHIAQFRTSHFSSAKKPGCKGGLFRGHPVGKPGLLIGAVPGHRKHHGPPKSPEHGVGIFAHHPHPHPHHKSTYHTSSTVATIAGVLLLLAIWTASFFVGYFASRMILLVVACVRKVFFGVPFPSAKKETVVEEGEGSALMGMDEKDEEELPVYEDAPAYEEKIVEEGEKQ